MRKEYESKKSKSVFIVDGTKDRASLVVTGDASTRSEVKKEVDRVRKQGARWDEADFIARQLSRTY